MKITFANHEFVLHHSGALFWPDQSLLIASDLHLEKGSHFARRGFFLPPYDSQQTLERLHTVIEELSPQNILLLGDCFHDAEGYTRLRSRALVLFKSLLSYNLIWINGNHDGGFAPDGLTVRDIYKLEGITFRHEATADIGFEISGHFHPKIDIVYKEFVITRPCFIEDGIKMILPSFGAYTGGLSVKNASIADLMVNEFRTYLLGKDRILDTSNWTRNREDIRYFD